MYTKKQKELLRVWITALRSGDYKQGKHALRQHDNYCCLGVAVDIFGKDYGINWVEDPAEHTYGAEDECRTEFKVLPPALADAFGTTQNFRIPYTPKIAKMLRKWDPLRLYYFDTELQCRAVVLSYLNDGGVPFSVIADILETLLETPTVTEEESMECMAN